MATPPLGQGLPGRRHPQDVFSSPGLLPSPPIAIIPPSSPSQPRQSSTTTGHSSSFAPRSLGGPQSRRSGPLTKPQTPKSGVDRESPPTSESRRVSSSEMKRSKPTFTTCRTYPENAPAPVALEPGADLQRSQRRSKVEAMSKLDRAGTPLASSSAGPSGTSFLPSKGSSATADSAPGPSRNPLHRPQIVNPPFKLEDVRTSAPRYPEPRSGTRPFNLPECPVFYPSPAEFSDPMAYIAALPPTAKEAGICKIVPPEGWRMPFSLEQDTFRFKTRLQRLNSLEAASRAKINFLEQLTMFHLQQGDRKVTIPLIDRKPLDLWRLRKEVTKMGGYEDVQAINAWAKVAEVMGHDVGWAGELALAYKKIVYPFDTLSLRAKTQSLSPLTPLPASTSQRPPGWVGTTPGSPTQPHRPGMAAGRMGAMKPRGSGSPHPPPPTAVPPVPSRLDLSRARFSPPGSQPPDSGTLSAKMRVPGFSSREGTESDLSDDSLTPPPPDHRSLRGGEQYQKGEVCEVCRKGNYADSILLCDGCDRGFHIFCLDPPLAAVPANEEWFCTPCLLSQGDDYGFEEGEEHSVASFSARDAAFSGAWWSKHRPSSSTKPPAGSRSGSGSGSGSADRSVSPTGKRQDVDPLARTFGRVLVTEDDVEREFWRLTESNTETVEVEYGADVHSTTHGSAAPSLETHPLDPYSKDGWNLNNMPILPESLLRYIKSDISGMTVPWIYIGMMFSAFCWHNEDHYTYSINYMYWGETKTWYGIPGADAEKFETAIKAEAPELFEQQPSLLYQLVTMMNPGRLAEQDVKVLACDQRPNEFVITFPKAYHCGFNHGINFNEAVNFALPDWLPTGKESVETYRKHAKPPVFSHHELLISITLYSDTIKTALWVQDALAIMVAEENARREFIRQDNPLLTEILVEEDCPEEQYLCCICKGFCYLSQITCSCTKLVACIEHADSLCRCPKMKRIMRKRFSDAQLEEILADVQLRASLPGQWRGRFMQVLMAGRPPLKNLRGLLQDGDRIDYPMPEVEHLRELVARANDWVEKVTTLATRKSAGRRRKGQHAVEEDDVDRSPQYLAALLKEADRLAFDAPEVLQIRQMVHSINSFQSEADFILSTPEAELEYERCQTALILGQGLQIELPEISRVEKVVKRLEWFRKVRDEVDDRLLEYEDVVTLLDQAKECEIPPTESLVVELTSREEFGRRWKSNAESLLSAPTIDLRAVEKLLQPHPLTPKGIDTVLQLESILKTANNWKTSAEAFLSGAGTIVAALRLCKAVRVTQGPVSRVDIPEISNLQAELDFHGKWLTTLAGLVREQATKVPQQLAWILSEIKSHLDPSDDQPNDRHSCFCRNPPLDVMVTCDTCEGTYHPKCVDVLPKSAALAFKCAMCKRATYDDRPSLHQLATMTESSKWNFIIVPSEMVTLRTILEKSVEYSRLIIPLLAPYTDSSPAPDVKYISHCARKLFTLPITFDAVDAKTNKRIVFEDWLFKRMREARQPVASAAAVSKANRARRSRLVLAESKEKEFRCICTAPPVDPLLQVRCSKCEQGYHLSCVLAPMEYAGANAVGAAADKEKSSKEKSWRCPCCTVREGKLYKNAELRVQDAVHNGTNTFIDYRATVSTFVEKPVYVKLPSARCILLHCTEFIPGVHPDPKEDGASKANGSVDDLDKDGRQKKKPKLENGDVHVGNGHGLANGHRRDETHSMSPVAANVSYPHKPTDVYRPGATLGQRSPPGNSHRPSHSPRHSPTQTWAPNPTPAYHRSPILGPMVHSAASTRSVPFTSNFPRTAPSAATATPPVVVRSSWRPPQAASSQQSDSHATTLAPALPTPPASGSRSTDMTSNSTYI